MMKINNHTINGYSDINSSEAMQYAAGCCSCSCSCSCTSASTAEQ
ncbi:TPA: listeriolysin S family TOMM bacteriocin [Staphylococcus argenteus]|nr:MULTISPECIES: listeriolysin S family TOMM bacteriocin [Staphylococcus]MBE2137273.1 listeriolysin S family TOMM bacteriocin [Staphylococcus argenteus]MDT3004368.1 listeriolysin S family TOMM bacteriocin [Staphylococcus argenteus]UPO19777.1 listeriolysin S family TOMM bacteriocin [Staphylococcus argenteus]UVI83775.1 listeriolysin S family TOMM bacteriocin [Staphylococcus aureus]HDY9445588.1 listeriolysin S family TOMM bacteriocin [Staphylococcus argenteus]